jgi:hypothetical protein
MNNNFFIIGESKVNFCEQDFYINGIGEIFNVLSSFIMVFLGFYGIYKINFTSVKNIAKKQDFGIFPEIFTNDYAKTNLNILYILLVLVGLGSVYFHWKLSLFAHWIDIIFISIILLYSQYNLSLNLNSNIFKHKIKYLGLFLGHFITSIYIPQIHIFLLFGTGFVVKNLIEYKIDKQIYLSESTNSNELVKKYMSIKKYFTIALVLWIIDYFGCKFIGPYHVHWIFHILIGYVSYKIIGLNKYLI